ncbi:ABC transporter permease [Amycolatopsis jejuensis]|uniref:ABC transporter permease n=1 Tax=Amycolatopsis jejuensis TaxID=330084 RepID=UPI00068D80FA|nr:ABC transporter permease [Amycolatopsis jejuensis]
MTQLHPPKRAATGTAPPGTAKVATHRPRRIRRLSGTIAGSAILAGLILAGFLAPLPHNPTTPDPGAILRPPDETHPMGTDGSGFDILARVIDAAQRDIPLALGGVLVSIAIGVPIGLLAGGRGRWTGWVMRAVEVFQAFPLIVLAIIIVKVSGNRPENVVLALAIVNVPRFIRLVRGEVLTIRESRFVEAAVATGCSPARVTFRHILPNVPGIILVQSSLAAANGIIVVATLNFIGLGANPPQPAWGAMIQDGSQYIPQGAWWAALFPGLAVFVTVVAFNLIADNLEHLLGVGRR